MGYRRSVGLVVSAATLLLTVGAHGLPSRGAGMQVATARHEVTHSSAPAQDLYVSTHGSDHNTGTTAAAPLLTLQAALDQVGPGGTIHLAAGRYDGSATTEIDGTATQPITIMGPGGAQNGASRNATVLTGISRVLSVNNSYYRIEGFTIDGEPGLPTSTVYPTQPAQVAAFKDSIQPSVVQSELVFVGADTSARGITGVTITNMELRDAGAECVRIRDDAKGIAVMNSLIEWCGLARGPQSTSTYRYHNGEGVYIGTSPKSTDQPMYADDETSQTVVSGNTILTYGSECVDVKENSHDNLIQANTCADNAEPMAYYGSGLEIRGDDNQVTANVIEASLGEGVKIASDSASYRQGGNVIEGNTFAAIAGPALANGQSTAQGPICGNAGASMTSPTAIALTAGRACASP